MENAAASSSSPGARTSAQEFPAVAHRRRRLARDDRRSELIDAAIDLLRAGSDGGNWVAEVTRAAGASKGTFYRYFASWEDMLAIIRERLIVECSAPLRDALAAADRVDWWTVLDEQCRRFVDLVAEFGRHHALIFHGVMPPRLVAASPSGPALLAAAIERGVTDGTFGPTDPEAAAELLFAAVHAAADAVLAGGGRERWVSACGALARGYLSPPSSGSNRRQRSDGGVPRP